MLNFTLDMNWDTSVNRWMVVDTDFGEKSGDANNVIDIHVMNMAMSQIIKIFEVLDSPVVATTINVIPGQVVSNTLTGTVLS